MGVEAVARPLSRLAEDSDLLVIDGAGHLPPIEAPAETTDAIIRHLERAGAFGDHGGDA